MIISIDKDKLPRNFSFVVKTHQIEEILNNNNIDTKVYLYFIGSSSNEPVYGTVFCAYYHFPGTKILNDGIQIYVHAVMKSQSYTARRHMTEKVLPEFIKWIKELEPLDEMSTLYHNNHFFKADLQGDEILIHKE